MPRCELTAKSPEVKNLVSHSNIKTKSVAIPNVQQKRVMTKCFMKYSNKRIELNKNKRYQIKQATSDIGKIKNITLRGHNKQINFNIKYLS